MGSRRASSAARAVVAGAVLAGAISVALTARAAGAPSCAPGTLLVPVPYFPRGILLLPDGSGLVVVDRGTLTLRDPRTLALRRALLPAIDEWKAAYVSADGGTLRAETLDGLRFTFDTATWRPTRLPDDRDVHAADVLEEDAFLGSQIAGFGVSAMVDNTKRFWEGTRASLGLPELGAGNQAVAMAFGIVRTRDGKQVLDPLEPLAPGADPAPFRVIVAEATGKLRMFDGDGKERASTGALAGAAVTALDVSGGHVLAGLMTGEVVIFTADLVVERRAMVGPDAAGPPAARPIAFPSPVNSARHGFLAMQYDPGRGRLFWLSSAREVGVFDLAKGRTGARLSSTGMVLLDAFFVDETSVVALTDEAVSLWSATSASSTATRRASYGAIFRAGGGLVGIGHDGFADVLDARTLALRRRVCVLDEGCQVAEPKRPEGTEVEGWNRLSPDARRRLVDLLRPERDRRYDEARKQVGVALSPDGRTLAVLESPFEGEGGIAGRPGSVTLRDARTMRRLRRAPVRQCWDGEVRFTSAKVIDACGEQQLDARTLATLAGKPDRPGRLNAEYGSDTFPVGRASVLVSRSGAGSEQVFVLDASGRNALQVLAEPEAKSGRGIDGAPAPLHDRHQLRSGTFAASSPSGRRFLVAGRADTREMLSMMGFHDARGGLQVWCTPERGTDEEVPPEPPTPAVADFDGITEVAADIFPETILAAAELGERVWVLGADAKRERRSLVAVSAGTRVVAAETLPPGGPWEHVRATPRADGLWLEGAHEAARRNRDGSWTSFPFGMAAGATTASFLPLSPEVAVHVAKRACTPAETAAARAEPNLRDFYAYNRGAFTVPAEIVGQDISVLGEAKDEHDAAARAALRARGDALAALVRAPGTGTGGGGGAEGAAGAGFAAIHDRAMKDPRIYASPGFAFSVVADPRDDEHRPFAGLSAAHPGDIVGPIETTWDDPYGRAQKLAVHFVRVEKVRPATVRPFSSLVEAARTGNWWAAGQSSGDCADLTIVGTGVRRTILPPHAAADVVAWNGGFAVVGNPLAAYDRGAWLASSSPVAAAVGAARAGEVKSGGDRLYINRRGGGLTVIDPASGKSTDTVVLPRLTRAADVEDGPAGAARFHVVGAGDQTGAVVDVDGQGRTGAGDRPRLPAWESGVANLVPGQTATWWFTADVLAHHGSPTWTAFANPVSRRYLVSLHRWGR